MPAILGFDPRLQLVHEDDVANALFHATEHDLPGVFNVAADGVLALSEIAGLLGKPFMPFLPPWGTGLALAPLRRLGVRVPPELMNLLRFGRGVDNRKLKATGFEYRYTTREAVLKLGEHLRLSPILKGAREPYRYEREVEEFLRWSPSVQGSESPLMRLSPQRDRGAPEAARRHRFDAEPRGARSRAGSKARRRPERARAGPGAGAGAPGLGARRLQRARVRGDHRPAGLDGADRARGPARSSSPSSRARPSVLHAIDSVLARAPAAR